MRTLALLALAALVTGAGGAHAQANLSPRYKGVTSEKLSVYCDGNGWTAH